MVHVRHLFIVIITPSLPSLSQDAFNGVYDVSFSVAHTVTFGDWKAKDGECSKCSSGGGGPITVERECKPRAAKYSCNGMTTMTETDDCLKFCGPSAGMYIARIHCVMGRMILPKTNYNIVYRLYRVFSLT